MPDGETPAAASRYPEILTTALAAELLHVHVEYLRRMVREGRIPAHRLPPRRAHRVGEGATGRGPLAERVRKSAIVSAS